MLVDECYFPFTYESEMLVNDAISAAKNALLAAGIEPPETMKYVEETDSSVDDYGKKYHWYERWVEVIDKDRQYREYIEVKGGMTVIELVYKIVECFLEDCSGYEFKVREYD